MRQLDLSIPEDPEPVFELQPSQVLRLLSPLRSIGARPELLELSGFDLSEVDSVSIITGLTQLTSLFLEGKLHDDGWALLEAAFASLEIHPEKRVVAGADGMSRFTAEAYGRDQL